jgi:hypothetical protein
LPFPQGRANLRRLKKIFEFSAVPSKKANLKNYSRRNSFELFASAAWISPHCHISRYSFSLRQVTEMFVFFADITNRGCPHIGGESVSGTPWSVKSNNDFNETGLFIDRIEHLPIPTVP